MACSTYIPGQFDPGRDAEPQKLKLLVADQQRQPQAPQASTSSEPALRPSSSRTSISPADACRSAQNFHFTNGTHGCFKDYLAVAQNWDTIAHVEDTGIIDDQVVADTGIIEEEDADIKEAIRRSLEDEEARRSAARKALEAFEQQQLPEPEDAPSTASAYHSNLAAIIAALEQCKAEAVQAEEFEIAADCKEKIKQLKELQNKCGECGLRVPDR